MMNALPNNHANAKKRIDASRKQQEEIAGINKGKGQKIAHHDHHALGENHPVASHPMRPADLTGLTAGWMQASAARVFTLFN